MAVIKEITSTADLGNLVPAVAVEMTMEEVSGYLDGTYEIYDVEGFDSALEEVQNKLKLGQTEIAYLVVRVSADKG